MRYIDEQGNFIPTPDPSTGYGWELENYIVAHHDAEKEVPDVWHYETIAEYPNGGKDIEKVIDVPGHPYIPAWDERETVTVWHFYSSDPVPTADRRYNVGELIETDGEMFEVISIIPAGSKLIPGSNVKRITLEEYINKKIEEGAV